MQKTNAALRYDVTMKRPIIGIDTDLETDGKGVERFTLRTNYVTAIRDAGGLPVLLPCEPQLASAYVQACDGVILTGGDDPRTEAYGQPTHPNARPIPDKRQAFISAILAAIDTRPKLPTLAVCLGMQMMSLHAGGKLHQYLPEILEDAAIHQDCRVHAIHPEHADSVLFGALPQASQTETSQAGVHENDERQKSLMIVSAHQQSVSDAGRLRVVATAGDGVIEAVDDPARRFYAGVQWHPERGDARCLSLGLLERFVAACRNTD